MQYLIDGYNLLFRLAKSGTTLKTKRLYFIKKLNDLIDLLSLKAIIIFDSAHPAIYPSRGHFESLEIIYTTKGLSADAFILEKLNASKHPEQFTVVTSDRDLAASTKMLKAKTLSIEAFLSLLAKKKTARKKKSTLTPRLLKDSDHEIDRLLRIFEQRLVDDLF